MRQQPVLAGGARQYEALFPFVVPALASSLRGDSCTRAFRADYRNLFRIVADYISDRFPENRRFGSKQPIPQNGCDT